MGNMKAFSFGDSRPRACCKGGVYVRGGEERVDTVSGGCCTCIDMVDMVFHETYLYISFALIAFALYIVTSWHID